MTNEALAVLAQGGDHEALLALWSQVQRLVWKQARRWVGHGGTTMEDLVQAGFVAVLRAVDSYDPTRARFSTHLFPFLQTEFSIATGQRLKRTALDPLQQAVSLDAPLTDDDEDGTMSDLIPDPAAQAAMEAIGEQDWHEHLHNALEAALNTLRPEERQVIVAHYYQGRTLTEIAADEGVSRTAVGRREQKAMMHLRHPSRSKALMAFL